MADLSERAVERDHTRDDSLSSKLDLVIAMFDTLSSKPDADVILNKVDSLTTTVASIHATLVALSHRARVEDSM
jgi:hypothetical protein